MNQIGFSAPPGSGNKNLLEEMIDRLKKEGFRVGVIAADHVAELESDYEKCTLGKGFDRKLAEKYLGGFNFRPTGRTIFSVSYPLPQTRFFFQWRGSKVPLIVPPTYTGVGVKVEQARKVMQEYLHPAGYSISKIRLPQKYLAVRSGLAQYGRNNISYVEGFGSFHGLAALSSDFPAIEDHWQEARMLPQCEKCQACINACPTGAISESRFLIRAEICLTYFNEDSETIPGWVDAGWHNSLVGCMRCQVACPLNRDVKNWIEDGEEFSEEETALLMHGKSSEMIPAPLLNKVKYLEFGGYLDVLGRNIQLLFAA